MKYSKAFDRIRDASLSKVGLAGLAVALARQLLRLPMLVHMARTWPAMLFLAVLGWRLVQLPIILMMAVLVVRGATQERL